MSGIYIPKIHLPENAEGWEVIIRIQPDGEVLTLQKIHLGIKAVPVPDHGRLIDASYFDFLTEDPDNDPEWDDMRISMRMLREYVKDAPSIIPADKEGADDEV